ncbi:hypothetical protein LBMAG48_28910 [Phycisphaerae bacterium]|nr:hypothetical protein LBMAG48_28910 [Phycisphaerae bacterium]
MQSRTFAKGESVIHTGKPEWGPGDIVSAEGQLHEGKPCQRLTIRFARAGLKTISTAFADLKPAEDSMSRQIIKASEESTDPLDKTMRRRAAEESLQKVPEDAIDPFRTPIQRLQSMLKIYKWMDSPAGVLEWATTQTGLGDPMSMFNRHELEQQLDKFRIGVDNHLKKLLPVARKADAGGVQKALLTAGPSAKAALRRVDTMR